MRNESNKYKKEEGQPDIAQDSRRKKSMVFILISIVIVVIFNMFFFNKKDKKLSQKPIEETYSIQTDLPTESEKLQLLDQPVVSNTTSVAAEVNQEIVQQQIALIQEKQNELQQRLMAPLMLVNASQDNAATTSTPQTSTSFGDSNTDFMKKVSDQSAVTVTASTIGPLNYVVAEGNLIHAILESAANSDLPGYLRAIVSEPVYSEDGTQVLIPKGSRLIGQYKNGITLGQSRIFIVWSRLITSNGISISLGSPGVDSLGVAGIGADKINRHFWGRFGTASLLSLIGAGAANVGVDGNDEENSASSYRTAVATSFTQSASQSLQQENTIATTLKTYQGKPIIVFVAKDLNFQNVINQSKPKLNVF